MRSIRALGCTLPQSDTSPASLPAASCDAVGLADADQAMGATGERPVEADTRHAIVIFESMVSAGRWSAAAATLIHFFRMSDAV